MADAPGKNGDRSATGATTPASRNRRHQPPELEEGISKNRVAHRPAVEPAPAGAALLTDDQAAVHLGVSVTVVKQLTREGWLPVVVLRRGVRRNLRRWSRAALDRFIEQRQEGGHMLDLVAEASGTRRAPRRGRT